MTDDNPFDDTAPAPERVEATPTKEPEKEQQGDNQPVKEPATQESEQDAETPAADEEKSEKFIPEHRFKAALKNVADERDALKDELKRLKGDNVEEPDVAGRILGERINMSREIMLETKEDYEDMENVFIELAKDDETLVTKMNAAQNPAKFAYKTAKEHLEIKSLKETRDSGDWKAFQEWKKQQEKAAKEPIETPQDKRKKAALSVPDLNKATAAKPKDAPPEEENVFKGAKF